MSVPRRVDRRERWFQERTFHWRDWSAQQLLERKQRTGARVSVVIPARDEERTVGDVVAAIRAALMADVPLVDELVVMDSNSTDATGEVAARAGAVVHHVSEVAPSLGTYRGKGEALWKSLLVTSGDLLVFVDADLTQWGPHFVSGLLGPLLADDGIRLVKGFYERLLTDSDGSTSTEVIAARSSGLRSVKGYGNTAPPLAPPARSDGHQPTGRCWAELLISVQIRFGAAHRVTACSPCVHCAAIHWVTRGSSLRSRSHRHRSRVQERQGNRATCNWRER